VLLFGWKTRNITGGKGSKMKFRLQFVDIMFIVMYSTLLLMFCNNIILSRLEIFSKVFSKWF
jgi:hypothetical protein